MLKEFLPARVRPKIASIYRGLKYRQRPNLSAVDIRDATVLKCCIAYNKHGAYCVPLSSTHTTASQALLAGNVYEPETIALLASMATKGDVVHAGAYIGDFLPALARASNGRFKILAFEPHVENFRCAGITVHLNSLSNVELSNFGLGATPGHADLEIENQDGPCGATSRIAIAPSERTQRIALTTVDSAVLVERQVTAIHLDVEGHEQEALIGALETIRRCRPLLALETMPDGAWVSVNLVPLGYKAVDRINGNTILSVAPIR